MKTGKFSKLLILSAVILSMTAAMAGCAEQEPEGIDPQYVAQLEQECVELRSQLQELQSQLGDLEQTVVLKSYTLKANPNEDNSGASVAITASPMRYEEGQTASFLVMLNGQEIALQEGSWDGSSYTASVDLPAEDGYSYECILTQADGSESRIIISSPEMPLYESCVYLASGLNVYCNMFVEDWALEEGRLILTSGYAQVQLPRIGNHEVDYKSSDLVLWMDGKELERVAITIPEGEAEDSYETVLENISFTMPEIEEGQALELILEVTLTDGQILTYSGCSWFISNGSLALAVG